MLIVGLIFWVDLRLEGEIAFFWHRWRGGFFDEKVSLHFCSLLKMVEVSFFLEGRGIFARARLIRDHQLAALSACFDELSNLFFVRIRMRSIFLLLDLLFLQLCIWIMCLLGVMSVRLAFLFAICWWRMVASFGIFWLRWWGMLKFHLIGYSDDQLRLLEMRVSLFLLKN